MIDEKQAEVFYLLGKTKATLELIMFNKMIKDGMENSMIYGIHHEISSLMERPVSGMPEKLK